ncbi:MAG: DUF5666 domain-containing protein [Armatimonadota bacterium]
MLTRRVLAVVVILAVVLAAAAIAQRGGPGGRGPGGRGPGGMAAGTVQDVTDTQIVIAGRGDPQTLLIAEQTIIVRRDPGTAADLAEGEWIALSGSPDGQGQFVANRAAVGDGALVTGASAFGGGFRGGREAVGKVTALQGNQLTIELQVQLSDDARISKVAQAEPADILPGEQAIAFGRPNQAGQVTARMIQAGPELFQGMGRGPGGGGARRGPGGPPGG